MQFGSRYKETFDLCIEMDQKTGEMYTGEIQLVGTSRKWTESKTRFGWGRLENSQWSHFHADTFLVK